MSQELPSPPHEKDLTADDDLDEESEESESEEEPSKAHLRHVKAEIEELAIIALHLDHRIMSGFPEHVLHTDCGKEMLATIGAQYVFAEKRGQNSEKVLRRALLAIAQDKGHILRKLFEDYSTRANSLMQGAKIWKNGSNVDTANILMRQRDGTVDTRFVHRSAVQKLCQVMADILGDHTYDLQKRLAMREAVVEAHATFGKELMLQVQHQEGSEGDA